LDEEKIVENLHEMGFVVREKRRRIRNRALLAVVLTVLLGGLMLAGARIDGLERELAREQARFLHSSDSVGMTGRTDTVMIGLKRATLQDGDVVLRIGIVGEERSEDGGWRMEEGKGKAATGGRDSSGNLGMTKGGKR